MTKKVSKGIGILISTALVAFWGFAMVHAMIPKPIAGSAVKEKPHIVKEWQEGDSCLPDDPIGPCPVLHIQVKNPLKRSVWVKIDCGEEYQTEANGTIRPRKTVTFAMRSDVTGGLVPGECKIIKWEYRIPRRN
jgi:hypothetical protein